MIYDLIVIGGGPAGMMAAARAAECGAPVVLLEKNSRLGKKLSITGGGRCNVTNNKPVVRTVLQQYGDAGKFLFSTYTQHGVQESIEWFGQRGVELHEENEGRLFPTTNSAETICQTLEQALKDHKVTIRTGTEVTGITTQGGVFEVALAGRDLLKAHTCVIATGGYSRPDTGSTGDGFTWLENLGHTINKRSLALVPIVTKERWVSEVSGLALPEIKFTIFADGVKQEVRSGKVLFTHVGLSGPAILNAASVVGELLTHSTVTLELDLFPHEDIGALRTRLTQLLQAFSNQKIVNSLTDLLPKTLARVVLAELSIDQHTPSHSVSAVDRKRLVAYLKGVPCTVARLLGADKAVISGGGVQLEEITFKTMESRLIPGLYVIGDMLDINRPSGGYSLQLCWSSGWVAGNSIAKHLNDNIPDT